MSTAEKMARRMEGAVAIGRMQGYTEGRRAGRLEALAWAAEHVRTLRRSAPYSLDSTTLAKVKDGIDAEIARIEGGAE